MKHIIQRVTSLLLCAVLLLQMVPAVTVHVHAEETAVFVRASVDEGLAEGATYLLIVPTMDEIKMEQGFYTLTADGDAMNVVSYYDRTNDRFVLPMAGVELMALTYGPAGNGSDKMELTYADGRALRVNQDGINAVNPMLVIGTSDVTWSGYGEDGTGNFLFPALTDDYYLNVVVETDPTLSVSFVSDTTQGQGYRLYMLCDHRNKVFHEAVISCEKEGNVEYWSCPDCGHLFFDEECTEAATMEGIIVPPTGKHTFGNDTAWEYKDGTYHATACAGCGEQILEQHSAECNDNGDGTHSLTCSICNAQEASVAHQWGEWSYNANMSLHVRTCQQCFAEEYSPLHLWGEAEYLEYPTCDYPGLSGATCTVEGCEATAEWEVAPLGHDLTEWYTMSEPTETTHGQQIRYCRNCGQEETRVIPAHNHEHKTNLVEGIPATCQEGGVLDYYACNVQGTTQATSGCGGMYLDEQATQQISEWDLLLPPLEHNWGSWDYPEGDAAASKGRMIRECTNDDCEETQQWINPLVTDPEHQHQMFKVEATESTCTVQGNVAYYICLNEPVYDGIGYQGYWDAEGTEPLVAGEELLPTAEHRDFEWVNESEYYHRRTCSACGYEETSSHTYGTYYPENGITETVCRRVCITCGYEEENPDGHDFINSGYVDCGDGEHHQSTCYFCKATFTMPHNWSVSWEGDVVTDHYCVEYGCYYSIGEEHIWVMSDERKDATCTAEGEQGYICAVEECTGEKTEPIPMLEHTDEDGDFFCDECETNLCFDQHVDEDLDYYCDNCKVNLCFDKHVDENADYYCDYCQTNLCFDKHPDENNDYYCDNCQTNLCFDQHVDEDLDYYCDHCQTNLCFDEHPDENNDYYCDHCKVNLCFDEHSAVEVPGKDATCTATGLTAGAKCQNCGMTLVEQEITEKLHHTLTYQDASLPTCESHGWSGETYCDVCGVHFTESTYLAPTGHHWSEWLISKEPTQLQHGWLLRYCLNGCGAFEEMTSPAKGHIHHLVFVEGESPLCCMEGIQSYYICAYDEIELMDDGDEGEYNDSCGCMFLDAEGTQQVTWSDLILPSTGEHTLGDWVPVDSGLDYEEQYERACSMGEVCGYYETRSEPKNHEHILVAIDAVEPTCEQNGTVAHYECTLCRCLYADETGESRLQTKDVVIYTDGHKYGEWRSDGEYGHSRECTQCEVVQIATKHQESPLPGDPTGAACATACLVCGYLESNANLHSYEKVTACTDRWQHQQSCSACGFELIEDHEFGAWQFKDGVHYRTCVDCGAKESSVEHLWDDGKETDKPGYKTHTCIVDGCGTTKEEFLRCMHTCFTCGKCTAGVTCPGKEPCTCLKPAPLVTTNPTFLTNNVEDPNQTYLGDILVKDQGDDLDPDAKPGQEIPEEYVGLTIGIQEVPLSDEETGEPVENPYTDYVEQALSGYETQHLFDIHLLDAEGKITESSGDAQYLVRLCLDEEIVLGLQKGLLRLAHITEKGTFFYGVTEDSEDCIPFYKLEGNLAWFWVDRFSPFALVKPEAPYYGREALAQMANKDALLYAYDQIVAGVEVCAEKIQIYPEGTTPAVSIPELQMVMDAYTRDHTENFWLESKYSISYKKALNMATAVKPTYSMTGDELAAARAEFDAAADEILHGITEEMSEFDRQLLIHDRLAERVVYDKTLAKPHVHDAYGAIVNGLAVCQGYAEAFQYLLRRVGIQSFIVTGYSQDQSHAWNMVRIDGKYYHTDLTWNDQADATYHAYFNMSDHYITEDHSIYTTAYPMETCVEMEANYFAKMQTDLNDLDANSEDAIAQKMKGSFNGVSFLLTESVTAEQFLYWFMANQRDIFTKADLINIEVKTPTYTCIGREAMISFVAEDGQPPHICGNGTKVPGQAPACTTAGWKDHYRCACGKLYAEQSCKTEITNLAAWKMGAGSLTASHSFGELVPAQQAIHTQNQLQNGVAAHYRCTVCEEYFTESKMVTTLSSLTTKPEHVFGDWVSTDAAKHWKACTTCGKKAWEGAHAYTDGKCNTCGYEQPKPGLNKPVVAPAGGSLTVTFAWDTPVSGKVLVAVYDLSGRMLGISYVESDTVDASGKTYTVAYDKSGTPRRIRAFVLKDGFAPTLDLDPIELQ